MFGNFSALTDRKSQKYFRKFLFRNMDLPRGSPGSVYYFHRTTFTCWFGAFSFPVEMGYDAVAVISNRWFAAARRTRACLRQRASARFLYAPPASQSAGASRLAGHDAGKPVPAERGETPARQWLLQPHYPF